MGEKRSIPIRCAKCSRKLGRANYSMHGIHCPRFKSQGKPVLVTDGAKENRGWTVFGTQDHHKVGTDGFGYTQSGYIFDTEEEAREFYRLETAPL